MSKDSQRMLLGDLAAAVGRVSRRRQALPRSIPEAFALELPAQQLSGS